MNDRSSTSGSETWPGLLADALACLDTLAPGTAWTLGGGTVLMLRHQHRLSHDIDVFLRDPQLLTQLSPRVNDLAAALSNDYVEASHFLKLTRPTGEIDFIVAPDLTGVPAVETTLGGRVIKLDPSVEIIAKKAFYRAASLKVRDVFDWAVVLAREPQELERLRDVLRSKQDLLQARLTALEPGFPARVEQELAILPAGRPLVDGALAAVRRFVDSW